MNLCYAPTPTPTHKQPVAPTNPPSRGPSPVAPFSFIPTAPIKAAPTTPVLVPREEYENSLQATIARLTSTPVSYTTAIIIVICILISIILFVLGFFWVKTRFFKPDHDGYQNWK